MHFSVRQAAVGTAALLIVTASLWGLQECPCSSVPAR